MGIWVAHLAELDEMNQAILRDNDRCIDGFGEVFWASQKSPLLAVAAIEADFRNRN